MKATSKIFLAVIFLGIVFLFNFNVQPAFAADNATQTVQQQIEAIMRQIISLLQQIFQLRMSEVSRHMQIQTPSVIQNQTSSKTTATLTVNATGVTAYVSINNGIQFAYTSPITLNNGDAYSVTASIPSGGSGNSTSKCSGIASSGGSYTCDIKMN